MPMMETSSTAHVAASADTQLIPEGLPKELNVRSIREDFPILKQMVHGKPLVYLDNAATSQKPQAVLEAMERFYTEECSNVHRGVHNLSERATEDYEQGRV